MSGLLLWSWSEACEHVCFLPSLQVLGPATAASEQTSSVVVSDGSSFFCKVSTPDWTTGSQSVLSSACWFLSSILKGLPSTACSLLGNGWLGRPLKELFTSEGTWSSPGVDSSFRSFLFCFSLLLCFSKLRIANTDLSSFTILIGASLAFCCKPTQVKIKRIQNVGLVDYIQLMVCIPPTYLHKDLARFLFQNFLHKHRPQIPAMECAIIRKPLNYCDKPFNFVCHRQAMLAKASHMQNNIGKPGTQKISNVGIKFLPSLHQSSPLYCVVADPQDLDHLHPP